MIVLDTHIWIWWVHGDNKLPPKYYEYIQKQESQGLGISTISCWEVAKLVKYFAKMVKSRQIWSHWPRSEIF